MIAGETGTGTPATGMERIRGLSSYAPGNPRTPYRPVNRTL